MNLVTRYIPIQGIKTAKNELIPLWDERIEYKKNDDYGIYVVFEKVEYYSLIDFLYDLKTKSYTLGIELNYYPVQTGFIKNEIILYEIKPNYLIESKIKEVKFVEYDLYTYKGKNLSKHYKKYFNDISIDSESLYAVKHYKPTYVLEDGTETLCEYELKHKFQGILK